MCLSNRWKQFVDKKNPANSKKIYLPRAETAYAQRLDSDED